MYWEVLPYPACSPDLAPSIFHLFDPMKEALEGQDLGLKMKLHFLCKDGRTSSYKVHERDTEGARAMVMYGEAGRVCEEIGITF